MRISLVVLLALAVGAPVPAAAAQSAPEISPSVFEGSAADATPEQRETARRAISRVRSPYCPGLMLEVCPSAEASALRDSMRVLGAAGYEADEIEEWMIARHGEEWRGLPRRQGFGIWAWLLPPLALAGGAGVLVWKVRRLRGREEDLRPVDDPEDDSGLSSEDEERLAAAMAEMEEE
jgi:cytochrome c-type biogenesis protein CcmH/NrfF